MCKNATLKAQIFKGHCTGALHQKCDGHANNDSRLYIQVYPKPNNTAIYCLVFSVQKIAVVHSPETTKTCVGQPKIMIWLLLTTKDQKPKVTF